MHSLSISAFTVLNAIFQRLSMTRITIRIMTAAFGPFLLATLNACGGSGANTSESTAAADSKSPSSSLPSSSSGI